MRTALPSLVGWFQNLSSPKRTLVAIAGVFSGLMLLSWIARPPVPSGISHGVAQDPASPKTVNQPLEAEMKSQWERIKEMPRMANNAPAPSAGGSVDYRGVGAESDTPLIAHAAELAVATKEFSRSRMNLEEILERHHGYAAKLRMVGQPAGSTLTATLRVPSAEFTGVVNDLKTLGSVQREEQSADEITVQRADLDARLRNAQGTLARLKNMLEQGWKAGNPAEIQRQLASVNGEIARLESERAASERRTLFSQVLFSLQEEITPAPVSFGAQFRGAATAGFAEALSDLSAIVLFGISRGPAILLWVVLLFFPSRWLWRRWHGNLARRIGLEPGI